MQRLSRRQTCAPHLLSTWLASFLIHRLKPKSKPRVRWKPGNCLCLVTMEGTPSVWWFLCYWYLSKHYSEEPVFFNCTYAHSHARTLTQRPYLNLSAHTRWHTLNNDSQLLPDTIKRCETQAGLPSESNNVSHSFLIFHANPFFQTNTGEQQIV